MTQMILVTGLSVWFGIIAGGVVWFGWGLAESVADRVRRAKRTPASADAET